MKNKVLQIFLVFTLALSLAAPVQAGLLKKAVKGGVAGVVVTKVVKNVVAKHASKITAGTAAAGSASQILKRNMGGIPKGFSAHHIIPVQLQNHPVLTKIGFDINQKANGIALPKDPKTASSFSSHVGSHPVYTNGVKQALDSIPDMLSKTETKNLVFKIMEICRKKLERGVFLHKKQGATPAMWDIKGELGAYIKN